ncbi:ABC transporter ATP-binding protein [Novosphingobium resinovorum]|uniref:ABC transporter ATP-binding protein n=1 Tax=Novosphingobium resinovorum TaxID=158500 RepID=UPI002ED4802B|nr:ABC transporter ATP-binding protein [Novosphingobium resinovorum]
MSLSCTSLGVTRGRRAVLSGIDFALEPGELVCLVGANGAGKSSLIRCLDGLWRPGEGEVRVDGEPLPALTRAQVARRIAYVPQAGGETMALSVAEMVALGRAPHRGQDTAASRGRRIEAALARFDLQGMAARAFDQLSGGERQRVLLARAFVQEARYLLLDEPTSALDLRHQLEALRTVRELVDELRVGALVAIHDLSAAARFADRLVLLERGRIRVAGPWQDVLTPGHLRAAFGIEARVGTVDGLPFVIPAQRA